MSTAAYILIQTEVGMSSKVANEITNLGNPSRGIVITSSEDVRGPYDVFVRVEGPSAGAIDTFVATRVQLVDGVLRTRTCPIIHLGVESPEFRGAGSVEMEGV